MWMLRTDRAELHFFQDLSSVPSGYAILSHTWNESGEQSWQDVKAISKRCQFLKQNPRDHVSPKIRSCCIRAERDGYTWVWIDTCCIDKTSSTELSEAINSMFVWYVQAEVCYALLEDVSSEDVIYSENSDFRRARWHTRGWTLQELLAPADVVFLCRDWKQIGTKNSLAKLLEGITGIARPFLTRIMNFRQTSVATRMRWAANRSCTRVEDEAYCLLGLFDINMPTVYGEGANAFQRLQEEIVKRSFDTTIFAWSDVHRNSDDQLTPMPLESVRSARDGAEVSYTNEEKYIFASSPHMFIYTHDGGHLYYTPHLAKPLQPYVARQWRKRKVCIRL